MKKIWCQECSRPIRWWQTRGSYHDAATGYTTGTTKLHFKCVDAWVTSEDEGFS